MKTLIFLQVKGLLSTLSANNPCSTVAAPYLSLLFVLGVWMDQSSWECSDMYL